MFQVDGYVSLYEVKRKYRFSNLRFTDQRHIMSRYESHEPGEDRLPWEHDEFLESRASRYCEGAFSSFVQSLNSFFLIDPSGDVKPVTKAIFSVPIEGQKDYLYLSDRFMCIDILSELEAVRAARLILNNSGRIYLNKSIHTFLSRLSDLEPALRSMLDFQGYSVFIRSDDAPDELTIRMMLELPMQDDDSSSGEDNDDFQEAMGRGGRPSKRLEILKSYSGIFPGGHEGRTWKEVASALRADGVNVSEVTIKRALKSADDIA